MPATKETNYRAISYELRKTKWRKGIKAYLKDERCTEDHDIQNFRLAKIV
jgi:hypothetical protein